MAHFGQSDDFRRDELIRIIEHSVEKLTLAEYEHTLEGADDMPAHAKSTLSGVSITIPITDGRLNLGT